VSAFRPEPGSLREERVRLDLHRFAKVVLLSRVRQVPIFDPMHETQRFVAELLGRKRTETVSYPATWWEHFKHRWFPRWALKRWPVQLRTVKVDAFALFPELEPLRAKGGYLELAFCEPPEEVLW
jgi:hypothetical protein